MVKLARKQNDNLQLNYQAIRAVFKEKSNDQCIFPSIKNLDPGCRRFYRTIGSEPLVIIDAE